MRKLICSIYCLIGLTYTQAQTGLPIQQDVMPALINPALQGISEGISAGLLYNVQWVGIDGAPTLSALSGAYRFKQHSAGVWIARDAFGKLTTDEIHLQYAFHLQVGNGQLTGGIDGYYQQQAYNFQQVNVPLIGDPALAQLKYTTSNITGGIAYMHPKGYFGISAQNMISNANNDDMFRHPSVNLFATGLYVYTLSDDWKIMPGLTYRLPVGSPSVVYIQGHVQYHEKIQLDFGYRHAGTYQLGMRWNIIPKVQFWYSYAYDTAFSSTSAAGGHEVGLRYGTTFY